MTANVDDWPTWQRRYPVPDGPWVMYQEWRDLLFAHWAAPAEALRPLVPARLPIDTHGRQAWVGVTPFRVTGARPRLVPALPWVSDFPELNLRTYVTLDGKPGVYFFRLDAGSALAVAAARTLFHLPYLTAEMHVHDDGPCVR